jgi:hypothetical protein
MGVMTLPSSTLEATIFQDMDIHDWIEQFDQALLKLHAIDHFDAGMDDAVIARYCDLSPHEAAKMFGEDYDLTLVSRDRSVSKPGR